MTFDAFVEVRLKPGVSDPEGATIERSLGALGFGEVDGVAVGKAIRLRIDAADEGAARARVQELCDRFLTNPVIQTAEITLR